MTITADNFFSWPVALWFGLGTLVVALVWLATARVHVMWQRTFCRSAAIALCFTPLPNMEMFTEGAMGGVFAVVPLWYALFWSIGHGAFLGLAAALIVWLIPAYVLWVAGVSIQHLFRSSRASLRDDMTTTLSNSRTTK